MVNLSLHKLLLMRVIALTICSLVLTAAVPRGWQLMGNLTSAYECELQEHGGHDGSPSAMLKGKYPGIQGFGTLAQAFEAGKYAGKRLRFRAYASAEGLEDWAGLWMRIDRTSDEGINTLAFDNMQKRPIRGTTDWREYEVVLDVPPDATSVYFGVLLTGSGAVRLCDARLDVVGSDVPVSSSTYPGTGIYSGPAHSPMSRLSIQPENLDFRN